MGNFFARLLQNYYSKIFAMKKVRFDGNKEINSVEDDTSTSATHNGKDVMVNGKTEVNGVNNESDSKNDVDKALRNQLEKAYRSIQYLEYQLNEKNSQIELLSENVKQLETTNTEMRERSVAAKDYELLESKNSLIDANAKIEQLKTENQEKEKTIEDLYKRFSETFEATVAITDKNGFKEETTANQEEVATLKVEIAKLEEKLKNSNEEKDYYKKHHQATNQQKTNGENGNHNTLNDEFGRELMMVNKRKYQLENRIKQLEHDLREAHNTNHHLERNLKNTEKFLWLEKERSATLENEIRNLQKELNEQKSMNDELTVELDQYHRREEEETLSITFSTETKDKNENDVFKKEFDHLQRDYDTKITDLLELKNKAEWRLGEVTQNWHDAKWRVGELEALLSHKDYEMEQQANRIKQIESILATPVTNMSDELAKLKSDVARLADEKSKVEWHLGEVTQYWNDAKWRIGALEGDLCQRNHDFDNANRRIADLENQPQNSQMDAILREKSSIEWRLGELDKLYNDAKWRVGELEAEVRNKDNHIRWLEGNQNKEETERLQRLVDELRNQCSKLEWRLGEVTQYWNDTKWRVSELQEQLTRKEDEMKRRSVSEGSDVCFKYGNDLDGKLSGAFIIKKQTQSNRNRWNTLLWENMVSKDVPMRRVWFEVEAECDSQEIFLVGSFLNWECGLLCERVADNPKRRGVCVDLPIGHHEFKFIRNGKWHTAKEYPSKYNEFGDSNNYRIVE